MDRIVWDKPEAERTRKLIARCLSIDLEVGRQSKRIHAFAAVRGDTGQSVVFPHQTASRNLSHALAELDELASGADYVLGHNLIAFDLPHLRAVQPTLGLLNLPAVDTLRLNPLAFPRNPYHHLVKHYQDAQIRRRQLNDPYLDSCLTLTLFEDQFEALCRVESPLLTVWHWLVTMGQGSSGFDDFFLAVRQGARRPSDEQALESITHCLKGQACVTQARAVQSGAVEHDWPLAYALAWLSVAGGDSVVPPWVRHQFPKVGKLIRDLRDTCCHEADCSWCRERHDPVSELKRWFGFPGFRPQPQDEEGRSLQQTIVKSAMAGQHVIGILPTGTGKSICYQIPALSRYDKTGALTVVISPLVALMSDQVTGMEAHGIGSCVAVNGLLSLPERAEALDRVRLGEISMLIISPEQLRNRAVRKAMDQREIGAWVLDEAHCLSQWGHDFRPDYRYVSRVIGKMAGQQPIPPVLCLTATAKPDVIADIQDLLRKQLDIKMRVFDGGSRRANLIFQVIPTKAAEKLAHLYRLLKDVLVKDEPGGTIIYCASRRQTEEIAAFLAEKDLTVDYFHAGMQPEHKKEVQQRFIGGELDIIVATNAFGMGIDKPNVRLVIHADIPGSLENYLQETGRAGRDQSPAHCILLYEPADVERQFGLSARGRLTRQFIHEVLRALRRLDRKKHANSEVVATVGEILSEEEDYQFERDSLTDDTKVRTSIAWLEEAKLLSREENLTQIFPSSLRINSVKEAHRILKKQDITETYRGQLLVIVEKLIEADADEGISTDHLCVSGLNAEEVRSALYHLEHFGIANNDTALTAFVHHGVARGSQKRFTEAERLESLLIDQLREAEPDMQVGMTFPFHLRLVTQKLKDLGCDSALPEHVSRILRSLSADGRGEEGKGSLGLRKLDSETVRVTLKRSWATLEKTAELRRAAAHRLLEHLIARLPPGSKGVDLLVETTISHLLQAIKSDIVLIAGIRKPDKLLDHALLWLHEQEIIRLNKGMAVFRPAMTILLNRDRRSSGFSKTEFTPLQFHYDKQIVQIHIMKEYAEIGLESMSDAIRMTVDYFTLDQADFLRRWLPGRQKEIERQTTQASWQNIVKVLNNPDQERIVADEREQTNVLALAGPGSGKTRVLVHRIAYLLRVRRENPRSIVALTYNRHAAVDIRQRIAQQVGQDARGVTILTCHSLAMRLIGASFSERVASPDDGIFRQVMQQATALLRGEGLPPEEADEARQRILSGFRWILVDEYQDIGREEYELIAALAGRTLSDQNDKLTLFAVGDDDQNIYSFKGASVDFIRRFESDYHAKYQYLTENYRSTAHIINAANTLIESAQQRMKTAHSIRIDRVRVGEPEGGVWSRRDPVGEGKVQILSTENSLVAQAQSAMMELQRLEQLDPDWKWSRCAVIAREWKDLDPVRGFCEHHDIPVQMGNEELPGVWSLRETQNLLAWLREQRRRLIDPQRLSDWLAQQHPTPWIELLSQSVSEFAVEMGDAEVSTEHYIEWLAEWGREIRRRQRGLLLLSAHRAKGLEFDHVVVLDGNWNRRMKEGDGDAHRRLYYVAMTRARQTLTLMYMSGAEQLQAVLADCSSTRWRPVGSRPLPVAALFHRYRCLGLSEVDLGFAGRCHPHHPVHQAIRSLMPGEILTVRHREKSPVELLDRTGSVVGRLARGFTPPLAQAVFLSVMVYAVITRKYEQTDPVYRDRMKCDTWEVVIPEITFAPSTDPK